MSVRDAFNSVFELQTYDTLSQIKEQVKTQLPTNSFNRNGLELPFQPAVPYHLVGTGTYAQPAEPNALKTTMAINNKKKFFIVCGEESVVKKYLTGDSPVNCTVAFNDGIASLTATQNIKRGERLISTNDPSEQSTKLKVSFVTDDPNCEFNKEDPDVSIESGLLKTQTQTRDLGIRTNKNEEVQTLHHLSNGEDLPSVVTSHRNSGVIEFVNKRDPINKPKFDLYVQVIEQYCFSHLSCKQIRFNTTPQGGVFTCNYTHDQCDIFDGTHNIFSERIPRYLNWAFHLAVCLTDIANFTCHNWDFFCRSVHTSIKSNVLVIPPWDSHEYVFLAKVKACRTPFDMKGYLPILSEYFEFGINFGHTTNKGYAFVDDDDGHRYALVTSKAVVEANPDELGISNITITYCSDIYYHEAFYFIRTKTRYKNVKAADVMKHMGFEIYTGQLHPLTLVPQLSD